MFQQIAKASTSKILRVFITNSSTGVGLSGLVYNSAGLTAYYMREGATAATAITLATITTLGTWETGGFKEIDATNAPGLYEFHPPDAALATGADSVTFFLRGAASMQDTTLEVQLTDFDLNSTAPDVNVAQISNDSVAADNLELQYDTTGLTGDTFPSTQSQLSGIANVGSAIHRPAQGYTLTTGTQSANTYTSTAALDGIRHEHTDTAGAMDLYYEFNIGSGAASSVQMTGYLSSTNDTLGVYGYDWVAAAWVQIGTLDGSSASNNVNSYDMFVDMTGSGANKGLARIRFYAASGLTTATLAVDQIFVAFSRGADTYVNARVWYDDSVANTNTVVGVDGTAGNPVSTPAAVVTLLASTNLNGIDITPGSTYTLASTYTSTLFSGHGGTIALGGQSVNYCHFEDISVSGIGTAANEMEFHDCEFGTASIQKAHLYNCTIVGPLTLTLAGDYRFIRSHSGIAGAASPVINKTAGQTISLEIRYWSGGLTLNGLESGDVVTIGGEELGTITLNGADATVEIRGQYKALVNNLTGSPTVTDSAIKGSDVATIVTDVAAILLDTGTDGVALPSATIVAIADALLTRDMSVADGGGASGRTVLQALRTLRNKISVGDTTMVVYKEDDTTASFTGTVTRDVTAKTLVGIDPA